MNQILLHSITLEELLAAVGHLLDEKLNLKQQQQRKDKAVYLTRKEVAESLRITLPTLHDYTKNGILNAYRIGSRVLYKEAEVNEAMSSLSTMKHKKGWGSLKKGID